MIYEWRCKECGTVVTVERTVDQYMEPPTIAEARAQNMQCDPVDQAWEKVITKAPGVPFGELRDRGIFMDEHGNYPPRKID